jgi:hypothetical protein
MILPYIALAINAFYRKLVLEKPLENNWTPG